MEGVCRTVQDALKGAAEVLGIVMPMLEAVCTYDPALISYSVGELADPETQWLENPRSGPRNQLFLEGHNILNQVMTFDDLINLPLQQLFVFLPRLLPGSCGQTSRWLFLLSTPCGDDDVDKLTTEFNRGDVYPLMERLAALSHRWCLRVRYGGHSIMVEGIPETQQAHIYQSFFAASSLSEIVERGTVFPLVEFFQDLAVLLSAQGPDGSNITQSEYVRLENSLLLVYSRLGTSTYDKIVSGEEEPNSYELSVNPLPADEVIQHIVADYREKFAACQRSLHWNKSARCLHIEFGEKKHTREPKANLHIRISEFKEWDNYVWYNCRSHPPPLEGGEQLFQVDIRGKECSALVVPIPPQTNGSADWCWYVLCRVTVSHYHFVSCKSATIERTCFPRPGRICECSDPPAVVPTASCTVKYFHHETGLWAGATEPLADAVARIEEQ